MIQSHAHRKSMCKLKKNSYCNLLYIVDHNDYVINGNERNNLYTLILKYLLHLNHRCIYVITLFPNLPQPFMCVMQYYITPLKHCRYGTSVCNWEAFLYLMIVLHTIHLSNQDSLVGRVHWTAVWRVVSSNISILCNTYTCCGLWLLTISTIGL